ncbi:(2Fe-2S)-binding protein [Candidatus Dojkabacteria bacterium]|uniref:(2Fe-2S)-binding protein n=1 Tax=Candidatus Dojkabacteria bacterium TaxID=2099670 RepID=A0A955RI92_9BACT|nr:(2Fe-2S)-binding protein [Candidatus Dojkabacteria bacterium]
MQISFELNGKHISLDVPPERRLVDVLREDLDCVGTKESCGEGQCGACSVLLNGELVLACLTPAIKINGAQIITIEGLGSQNNPDYIQQAFIDADAIQCGFCTPGIIMTVKYYIENNGSAYAEDISKALSGNICRCTGYKNIIKAVQLAIKTQPKSL